MMFVFDYNAVVLVKLLLLTLRVPFIAFSCTRIFYYYFPNTVHCIHAVIYSDIFEKFVSHTLVDTQMGKRKR